MIFVKKITNKNVAEVSYLLRPFFQSRLLGGVKDAICFALYCIETPIGVIYGEKDEVSNKFLIKQLSLTDKFKGRKLEKLLLNEIESVLAGRNEKEIVFSFQVSEGGSADYIMNILKENGWQEPSLICHLFGINNKILNWKWLNLPLAKDMKTYKWNQLPGELIDKLVVEQKTDGSFPDYILDYLSNNKFSHERSAAIVTGNNIVGWTFVEVTEANNFIYSWSFIKPQHEQLGQSMGNLFKETISKVEIPSDFNFIFAIDEGNHRMFNFLNRMWKPYISTLNREYHSKKKL